MVIISFNFLIQPGGPSSLYGSVRGYTDTVILSPMELVV